MIHFLTGFGLWLHGLFWGLGLAVLVAPRRWARQWPVWVPLCGWALQSAVVWFGSALLQGGTNRYALMSEVLPALLLVISIWRRGPKSWLKELLAFRWLWLASALVLALLILPLARSEKGLTSISFGSCDAADYAAGARVFQEYGPADRGGFLGHTEVVQVMSSDNFQDFWRRLNHFTPSALIAHHGSILHSRPHQLTTLFTASLLAASLPMVFWLARSLMRLGRLTSLGLALLFGLTPLTWYPVFHVAPAQMLAAQAIAALTWLGIRTWQQRVNGTRFDWTIPCLLFLVFWVLLGSYNFILLVCLCPVLAFILLGGTPWQRRQVLVQWILCMAVPFALASLVFYGRVSGLIERFRLFRQYDFGWKIPVLSPEGWLGMVADTGLQAYPTWSRVTLSLLVIGLVLAVMLGRQVRNSFRLPLAAALCLPALAGYAYLNARGAYLGTNASYDAFKLLSVFYPGLLVSLGCVLIPAARSGLWRLMAATLIIPVVLLNAIGIGFFITRASHPPLAVHWPLNDLRKVDGMARIESVNMLVPDFWDRLWANYFLLNKQQYFITHTYEGRLPTALKGQWDLSAEPLHVQLPGGQDSFDLNFNFHLANTQHPLFVRAQRGFGWYGIEQAGQERWSWGQTVSQVILTNPHNYPLLVKARLNAHAFALTQMHVLLNGVDIGDLPITDKREEYELPELLLPPGVSYLNLDMSERLTEAEKKDPRDLALCLFDLTLRPARVPPAASPNKAQPKAPTAQPNKPAPKPPTAAPGKPAGAETPAPASTNGGR